VIETRVKETDGRISAKRLLPVVRAAVFTGSDRSLRRAVHEAKARWRRRRRVFRPWVTEPGQHLIIDYGTVTEGPNSGMQIFTAVLGCSRVRFVRFPSDQTLATTPRLLAECFVELGGVPAVVLADRMGCLRGPIVANVVVPPAEYVRFATGWRFRPDFCEGYDPQSKGAVENLVGYCKRDLIVPAPDWAGDLAVANTAAVAWCLEVNGRRHSEIAAIPSERLITERGVLRPLPSTRPELLEGGVADRPRRRSCAPPPRPARAASPRTWPRSSPWLPRTARPPSSPGWRGQPRSVGSPPKTSARSSDAGPQAPEVTPPGQALPIDLPKVTVRSLEDYRVAAR